MARRPSFLPAVAGAVTALVLSAVVAPGASATRPDPHPAPPAPSAPSAASAPSTGSGRAPSAAAERADDTPAPREKPAEDEYDAPLDVTIDDLTPGALPRRGPVVVRGRVTNVDLEAWHDINLYPMFGAGPACSVCSEVMTTSAELDAAAASEPEAPVGERSTQVRDVVPVLQPGQSASYTIRIPQQVLRQLFPDPQAGVYWFGVHALGADGSGGRDEVADGRARTFLPYVPPSSDKVVDTAVVVPLRGRITYASDGRLDRTEAWARALSIQGSIGGPLAFGSASGGEPVTWLVDPALPDAVRHLARGNAPRQVQAVRREPEPSPSEGGTEASEDADSAGSAADDGADPTADDPLSRAAQDWLRQAEPALKGGHVATLPYGDPDVAAAATAAPDLYETARKQQGRVLADWDVAGEPVVAPPNGYLDQEGIESVSDGAAVVLGDQMFPRETFGDRLPATGRVGNRPVVVRSSGAAEGGPGPDPRLSAVALRQRLLSEAVVRLLAAGSGAPEPLVVLLPSGVDAAGASSFWEGFDLSWLRAVDLSEVVDRAEGVSGGGSESEQIDPTQLSYPQDQDLLEIDTNVLAELDRLVRDARSLQSILGEDYRISGQLLDEALAGASYALRSDPRAWVRLSRTRTWVRDQLARITVDAPQGVTLSGTAGSFNVSVRNALDYPVTVRIEATTDSGARIGVANPVQLAANSRSSVPISADMSRPGVHNVTLRITDLDGRALGGSDGLPIRSGQVGVVIWAIIGTGVGILFAAIAIRLFRRVRAHRQGAAT